MSFTQIRRGELVYMTAPNIAAAHAFTTRYGGSSRGIFSSLNLGQNLGDERLRVLENYAALFSALGISGVRHVSNRQAHGDTVLAVGAGDLLAPYEPGSREADGLITCEENVPLMVFTADCVPILLHDPVRGAVGAVHAGWRGTVLDIAGKAADRMRRDFGSSPGDIRAAIGPCISKCCYETGDDVARAVLDKLGAEFRDCMDGAGGKYKIDLKEINRRLLVRAGADPGHIEVSDECTRCLGDKYWSHRGTRGQRGSQAAVITLGQTRGLPLLGDLA